MASMSAVQEACPEALALPSAPFFALLALCSGATDAFGFFQLGGTFTSVMTGNLVLFAAAVARPDGQLIARTSSAICGYLLGTAMGVWLAGPGYVDNPQRTVRRLLAVEVLLLTVYGIVYQVDSARLHEAGQAVLLGGAAIALGMQSCASQSYREAGLSTTFLTGTLTGLTIHLASGKPLREATRAIMILGGLLAGAAAVTTLASSSPRAAAFLPAALVTTAAVFERLDSRSQQLQSHGARAQLGRDG